MQTHKLNKKAIAVTGLPEGAYFFEIRKTSEGKVDQLYYRVKDNIYITNQRLEMLPPGNWRILGFAQDLNEEDWKLVVDEITSWGKTYNMDYLNPRSFDDGFTKTQSGHSLLKSEGIELLNTLILIIE